VPEVGHSSASAQEQIVIQMPAEGIYVAVLRTAIAGMASRCNFTVEEIEDLRIALDEATAMLLARAAPDSLVECRCVIEPDRLVASVTAEVRDTTPPDTGSFGWLVLSALAGAVDARFADSVMTIELSRPRAAL
jgi:serine/threonine-protein kinase RsbW